MSYFTKEQIDGWDKELQDTLYEVRKADNAHARRTATKNLKVTAQRLIEKVFATQSKPLTITIGDLLKAKGVK